MLLTNSSLFLIGLSAPIRNKEEFVSNINQYVSVYLKEKDENDNDMYTGDLLEVNENDIVLSYKDKTRVKKISIKFENIEKAHLAIKF